LEIFNRFVKAIEVFSLKYSALTCKCKIKKRDLVLQVCIKAFFYLEPMRISFLLLLFFSVNLFAEDLVDTTQSSRNSEDQALVEALAVRDSVMAVRDSAAKATEAALRTELQNEQSQCKNWEHSWNTLKDDHEKCTKALRVSIEAQMEGTSQKKDESQYMTVSSFLAGIVLGLLAGWYLL